MKRATLFILTTLFLSSAYAQKMEKVYLDKSDSTRNNYTILYPPKLPWTGFIIIIPGFGETAEHVLLQTEFPKQAAANGLLTIIPTFQDRTTSFGVDSSSQQMLRIMLKDVTSKHKLMDHRFFIGGFSIGGSCAIKYAEHASIRPAAIFAIDPPLDFERFYNTAKRDIRLSKDGAPNRENVYMVDRIEKEAMGTPQTNIGGYYRLSPYSFTDTSQAALKNITQTPIRIYAEPDIHWWQQNRGADLSGMNVTDCAAFINELDRLGNKNASLILTQNKGYRKPNHMRHPHSWSIVDNNELLQWLLAQSNIAR